jgi:hypothetical protein
MTSARIQAHERETKECQRTQKQFQKRNISEKDLPTYQNAVFRLSRIRDLKEDNYTSAQNRKADLIWEEQQQLSKSGEQNWRTKKLEELWQSRLELEARIERQEANPANHIISEAEESVTHLINGEKQRALALHSKRMYKLMEKKWFIQNWYKQTKAWGKWRDIRSIP